MNRCHGYAASDATGTHVLPCDWDVQSLIRIPMVALASVPFKGLWVVYFCLRLCVLSLVVRKRYWHLSMVNVPDLRRRKDGQSSTSREMVLVCSS